MPSLDQKINKLIELNEGRFEILYSQNPKQLTILYSKRDDDILTEKTCRIYFKDSNIERVDFEIEKKNISKQLIRNNTRNSTYGYRIYFNDGGPKIIERSENIFFEPLNIEEAYVQITEEQEYLLNNVISLKEFFLYVREKPLKT